MITTEKIKLSASKIKTAEGCSWLYYTKYVLKLPDISNSGASRGTICHLIFELLLTDRHKKYFEDLCSGKAGVIKNPCIHRLILKNALSYTSEYVIMNVNNSCIHIYIYI